MYSSSCGCSDNDTPYCDPPLPSEDECYETPEERELREFRESCAQLPPVTYDDTLTGPWDLMSPAGQPEFVRLLLLLTLTLHFVRARCAV